MGWLEGMLTGFMDRKHAIEERNLKEAVSANEREAKLYQLLLSSPDPGFRAMAATGMMQSSQPRTRTGGLRGWFGEIEGNPIYPKILQYMQTPQYQGTRTVFDETTPEQAGYKPALPTAPPETAAMPATETTTPGAPPPAPQQALPPPPPTEFTGSPPNPLLGVPPQLSLPQGQAGLAQGPRVGGTTSGAYAKPESLYTPRQEDVYDLPHAFPTAEETATLNARARSLGDIRGDISGYTEMFIAAGESPEVARKRAADLVVAEHQRRSGSAFRTYPIVYVDPTSGETVQTMGTYDTSTGHWTTASGQPIDTDSIRRAFSGSLGAAVETAAQKMGYPSARMVPPDRMGELIANANALGRETAYQRGKGTGQAAIETELDKPIGVTAARELMVPPTTRLRDLDRLTPLDQPQRNRLFQVQQVETTIKEIESLLTKVFPSVDVGWTGKVETAFSLAGQWLQGNPDLGKLDAAINLALGNIAKIGGDTGNLSTSDIERARAALLSLTPSIFGGDTLRTAQARVGVVYDLLQKAKQPIPGYVGNAPGSAGSPGTGAVGTAPATVPGASGYVWDSVTKQFVIPKPPGQ